MPLAELSQTADVAEALVAKERERCELKPLTRTQIAAASRDAQISFCLKNGGTYEEELVRVVERAHGIGGAPEPAKG